MRTRRGRLLVTCSLIALALAAGAGLWFVLTAGRPSCAGGATCDVAQAYVVAMMAGDKKAAYRLYRADALCSAPEPYPSMAMDQHMAMLASSRVRRLRIVVASSEGVAHPPGSESARITFLYRSQGTWLWRWDTIWLVTGPPDADGERFVCYLVGE